MIRLLVSLLLKHITSKVDDVEFIKWQILTFHPEIHQKSFCVSKTYSHYQIKSTEYRVYIHNGKVDSISANTLPEILVKIRQYCELVKLQGITNE